MVNIFKVMATLNKRILYLTLLILIIVGCLYPIALPITVTPWTTDFYNKINAVQPGEILLVHWGEGPGVEKTMWSAIKLTLWQFMQRRVKIIWMTTMPMAPPVGEMLLNDPLIKDAMKEEHYVVGTNFTDIGFVYMESGLVNFVKDIQGFTQNKFKDTFVGKLKDMNDIQYCYYMGGDPDAYKWLAQHVSLRFKTKIFTISDPSTFPTHLTYLKAGNFYSCLDGVTGSAEYELLTGKAGPFLGRMGAISTTSLFFALVIVLGNIGYFGWERKERVKPIKVGEKNV
jgi:hypothetical protein